MADFMFQNAAYRATVYRIGVIGSIDPLVHGINLPPFFSAKCKVNVINEL